MDGLFCQTFFQFDGARRIAFLKANNQTIAITRLPGAEEIKNKGANWNPETTSWRDKVKPGCKVQIEADVIKGDGQKDRITAVFTIKK